MYASNMQNTYFMSHTDVYEVKHRLQNYWTTTQWSNFSFETIPNMNELRITYQNSYKSKVTSIIRWKYSVKLTQYMKTLGSLKHVYTNLLAHFRYISELVTQFSV